MVLEAVAALGVASSIVQIIDFARKLVIATYEAHQSSQEGGVRRQELEVIASNLLELDSNVQASFRRVTTEKKLSAEEQKLESICANVSRVASQLVSALEVIKVRTGPRIWKDFREALNLLWNSEKIDELARTLDRYRGEIDTFILVFLRTRIDDVVNISVTNCTRLEDLGLSHQKLTDSMTKLQNDLSTQVLGLRADLWQAQLVNTMYEEQWEPFTDRDKIKPNYVSREKVSERLGNAAMDSRTSHLKRKLLGRLQFPSIRDRLLRISHAHVDTFKWVFHPSDAGRHSAGFATWLESGHGTFWVTGKPASGKSTFMKHVFENKQTMRRLNQWAGNDRCNLIVASYFFWKAGHNMQKTQAGLLQTLLHDVLKQNHSLIERVLPERWEMFSLFGDDFRAWTWPELRSAFLSLVAAVAEQPDLKIFIMIDGMDECEDSHEDLVEVLEPALVLSSHFKFCIGSRPEQHFQDAFGRHPHLRMQDLTYPDILAYVNAKLCARPAFRTLMEWEPGHATELVTAIAQKASGVFLWVHLVTKSLVEGLNNSDRISDLKRRLEKIPPELDELYSDILYGLDPFYLKHASQIFQMVRQAPEALSLLDLSFADDEDADQLLARDPIPINNERCGFRLQSMARRVNSRCKGLLELSTNLEIDAPTPATQNSPHVDENATLNGPHQPLPSQSDKSHDTSTSCEETGPSQKDAAREVSSDGYIQLSKALQSRLPVNQEEEAIERPTGLAPAIGRTPCEKIGLPPDDAPREISSDEYIQLLRALRSRLGIDDIERLNGPTSLEPLERTLQNHTSPAMQPDTTFQSNLGEYTAHESSYLVTQDNEWIKEQQPSAPGERTYVGPWPGLYMGWYRNPYRDAKLGDAIPLQQATLASMYSSNALSTALLKTPHNVGYERFAVPMLDYLHRTAKDFVEKPENWNFILAATKDSEFDVGTALLRSSILLLYSLPHDKEDLIRKIWATVRWSMSAAAMAEESTGQASEYYVDQIDRIASRHLATHVDRLRSSKRKWSEGHKDRSLHWVNTEPGVNNTGGNMITLAVRWKLTRFVALKAAKGVDVTHDDSDRPMLDYVMFPQDLSSEDPEQNAKHYPPSPATVEVVLKAGANPNEWSNGSTPWQRALEKLLEFKRNPDISADDHAHYFRQWYDVFVLFVKAGADPKADLNSGNGSFARECFEQWDAEKAMQLQKLIRTRQRKLPQWTKKLRRG